VDIYTIWVGTDDGLIHVTRDGGKTWKNVTPPELKPWAKVSLMDASHTDPLTAYAAVNTFRLDDLRPHIYRTKDGGKTWTHIANGIPNGGIVNVVREDPKKKGLLFAGTEQAVYYSLDDGERWQSLRLNTPATSIRDLVIKDDDVVVGTHGRSFWILDDITPLRQMSSAVMSSDVHLFAPQNAWRVRWNMNTDTPLPPEEPAGQNPPDGAIINYVLKSQARGPVTLGSSTPLVASCAHARAQTCRIPSRTSTWCRNAGFGQPDSVGRRRLPSFRLGPALRASEGRQLFVSNRRHLPQHRENATWAVGVSRPVHRQAHRGRQEPHAAAHGEDGSEGEDARPGTPATAHVVAGPVRRHE
jgi:hypothetical protein